MSHSNRMHRHMRDVTPLVAAVMLSVVCLLMTTSPSHADSHCDVSLQRDGSSQWSDHLTLHVGDRFWVHHSGRIPDSAIEEEFMQAGAEEPQVFGIWSDNGSVSNSFWIDPGDEGNWTFRAYQLVDGTEVCSAVANFEVLAGPEPSMAPTPAPRLPDTAVQLSKPDVPLLQLVIALAAVTMLSAARARRRLF